MVAGCSLLTAYNYYLVVAHGHGDKPDKALSYMHIRSKAFPWKCPDCDLLDGDCWDACQGKPPKEHH